MENGSKHFGFLRQGFSLFLKPEKNRYGATKISAASTLPIEMLMKEVMKIKKKSLAFHKLHIGKKMMVTQYDNKNLKKGDGFTDLFLKFLMEKIKDSLKKSFSTS